MPAPLAECRVPSRGVGGFPQLKEASCGYMWEVASVAASPCPLPRVCPPRFPFRKRMVQRGMELGCGAHCPKCPGAAVGVVCAHCKGTPGEMRGWVPGEAVPPGPSTLTGLCWLPPGHCGEERDAAAAGSKMHQQQRQQPPLCPAAWRGTSTAPTSPQHLQWPWQHISALQCGVIGDLGFRHSPVTCGTTCERGNIFTQTWTRAWLPLGPPALHGTLQGQPLSLNPPQLPLLLPPPEATRRTVVTRTRCALGTGW